MNQIEFVLAAMALSLVVAFVLFVYCDGLHVSVQVSRSSGRTTRARKVGRFLT